MIGVGFVYLRLLEKLNGISLDNKVSVNVSYHSKVKNVRQESYLLAYPISYNKKYLDVNGIYYDCVWTIGVQIGTNSLHDLHLILDTIERYFSSGYAFVCDIDEDNAVALTDIDKKSYITAYLVKLILGSDYDSISVGDTVSYTEDGRTIYGQVKYKDDDEDAIYVFLKEVHFYDIRPERVMDLSGDSRYLYTMNVDIRIMGIMPIDVGGV